MKTRNWEDWAFGVSLATAVAFGFAWHAASAPFASDAIAAENAKPTYSMTITAHRLPAECKGVAEGRMSAMCQAAMDTARIVVRRNRQS